MNQPPDRATRSGHHYPKTVWAAAGNVRRRPQGWRGRLPESTLDTGRCWKVPLPGDARRVPVPAMTTGLGRLAQVDAGELEIGVTGLGP
jgi:hypothetical protein